MNVKTKRGYLTAYGLACGYVQTLSQTSHKQNYLANQVLLEKVGAIYVVKTYHKGNKTNIDYFETVTSARKHFKSQAREYHYTVLL